MLEINTDVCESIRDADSELRGRIGVVEAAADKVGLALWWGVVPLMSGIARTTDAMVLEAEALLKRKKLAAPGDVVLMLGGQSHTAGATNMILVHTIS